MPYLLCLPLFLQSISLGEPYSKCVDSKQNIDHSVAKCQQECETAAVFNECSCKAPYMRGVSSFSIKTVHQNTVHTVINFTNTDIFTE